MCEDFVAYWGKQKNTYYASIYDLNIKNVIKEAIVGEFELGTDFAGHFPVPEWNKECSKVIFPKHEDQPEDITIEL